MSEPLCKDCRWFRDRGSPLISLCERPIPFAKPPSWELVDGEPTPKGSYCTTEREPVPWFARLFGRCGRGARFWTPKTAGGEPS